MSDVEVEALVQFFKTLADATRLRIVGLLAVQPRTVDELATLTEVRPPTVSHHLARLRKLGLVRAESEGTTRHYTLQTQVLETLSRQTLAPSTWTRLGVDADDEDAWPRKILRDFVVEGRLQTIPASRKKRAVILEWLASQFEAERVYSGPEVNAVIQAIHADSATLRREMIGAKWLTRDDYGHAWQRNPARHPRAFI